MSALPNPNLALEQCPEAIDPDELSFWERAFLAALPCAINGKGWTMNGTEVTSGNDRIKLCAVWADRSVDAWNKRRAG